MKRPIFPTLYSFLPLAVFGFLVLAFALHPVSPFYTHRLEDPDDVMRLNQVMAWLQGQSWFDLSVPRLSPGDSTVIHWSRLIDVPIALVALPFKPFLGIHHALFIAALLVPLFWFALFLAMLIALAQPFVGPDRAKLTSVMALFAPLLLYCFTPGLVDHHGVQILIAGFGLLSLFHILENDRGSFFAVLSALAFACGFWIGAESLPWAMAFIACLGLGAAIRKEFVAHHAALFGLCLFGFTTILLPLALPFDSFSSRALSWFSPAYALFAGLSGAVFVLGWVFGFPVNDLKARFSLYALLGIGAGLGFFALIPNALNGPFADYNAFDSTVALDNIIEAQPLIDSLHVNRFMPVTFVPFVLILLRFLALPVIAFFVCLNRALKAKDGSRLLWFVQGVFLLAAILLSLFWQFRVGRFMELFSIVPITFLLVSWWDRLRWGLWDRPLFWAEIGTFLVLGPLPVVLVPSLVNKTPLYPNILLFPAARAPAPCRIDPVLRTLNNAQRMGEKPLTIMNTGDSGPEILFATPHNVLAGNYNVSGNRDSYAFFAALDDADALKTAGKRKADLVLVCRKAPSMYLGKDYFASQNTELLPGDDGLLHFTNTSKEQPLIQRLIRGNPPSWLKPIELFEASDYLLFRIQYPKGKK